MSLQEVGTQLVVKNGNQFFTVMTKANKVVIEFGDSAKKAGEGTEPLNKKSAALAVTVGNVLTGALNAGANALRNMASGALNAVSTYEKMEQSMTSLVAKEIKTTRGIDDMGKALEMAAPRAEELLGWIQDLAIKSPFDQQGVAMAFKTALAYGFTTDQAQRLTAATIDFTTATGASSDTMDRVALALGQIKARGKLMGGEMIQLVSAGFNVNEMLAEMGYTADDVSKGMVSAGEFITKFTEKMESDFGGAAERSAETVGGLLNSLDDLQEMGLRAAFGPVIQAALPYVSALTDKFQKALPYVQMFGEYLAKGFTFLIENRGTILTVAGIIAGMVGSFMLVAKWQTVATAATAAWAAVTGTATVATTGLAGAVTFLLSPLGLAAVAVGALVGAFALIGVGMKKARDKQQEHMAAMTADAQAHAAQQNSIDAALAQKRLDNMGQLGDKLQQQQAQKNAQTAEQSRSWGENIVIQFAQGMANAIKAVIQVLNEIGQAIAHWLAPGSPPKILPLIDKWGTSAMNQFIGGMRSADFDMVNKAADPIKSYFESLGKDISPKKNIKIKGGLASLSQEQAKTGSVSDKSFDAFFQKVKLGNQDMQNYVRTLFQVQAAQDKLNQVTSKYEAMLSPLNKEMNAIQKRRQEVVDSQRKEELKDIIARAKQNGDSLAVELAQMELREMAIRDEMGAINEKKAVEETAAQAEYDAAQEKLAIQQAVIDAQMEANRMLNETDMDGLADALGSAESAAGGLKSGLEGAAFAMDGLTSGMGGMENPITSSIDSIKERFGGLVDDLKAPFAGIGEQLTGLGETWLGTFDSIKAKLDEAKIWYQEQKDTWTGNVELMKTAGRLFKEKVSEFWASIKTSTQSMLDRLEDAKTSWREKLDLMKTDAALLWEKVKDSFDKIKNKITDTVDNFILTAFDNVRDKIKEMTDGFWGVHDVIDRLITKFGTFVNKAAAAVGVNLPGSNDPNFAAGGFTGMKPPNRIAGVTHGKELVVPYNILSKGYAAMAAFARQNVPRSIIGQPQGQVIMPPASPQYISNNNTTYNQQRVQGIGQVTLADNGISIPQLEVLIRRVVAEAVGA